jgi:hypothetical protein
MGGDFILKFPTDLLIEYTFPRKVQENLIETSGDQVEGPTIHHLEAISKFKETD